MANWAKVNSENIVEDILLCDYDFIEVIKSQNPDYSYIEYSLPNYTAPGYPYNPEKSKFLTPKPATPEAMADVCLQLVRELDWSGPIGCGFPAIVKPTIYW